MVNNILIMTGTARVGGGVESNLLLLLDHFNLQKISPIVIMPGEGPLTDQVRLRGIPTSIVSYYGWRCFNPLRHLLTIFDLMRLSRSYKIDLIYLNHHCLLEFAAKLSKLTRLPLVCHMHGVEEDNYMAQNLKWLKSCNAIIAASKAVLANIKRFVLPEQRITLIYSAIDAQQFTQEIGNGQFRHKLNIPNRSKIVGTVARIRPDKGIGDFIHAAAKIHSHREEIYFVIIGSDEDGGITSREYMDLAVMLDLNGHLFFTGFIEDMSGAISELDVFVLASWMEACPLSVMEAMASGKLVVVTEVGGVPEIIQNGINGMLCPTKNPQKLAETILVALDLPDQQQSVMKRKAIDRIHEQFDIALQAHKIEDLFLEVLS